MELWQIGLIAYGAVGIALGAISGTRDYLRGTAPGMHLLMIHLPPTLAAIAFLTLAMTVGMFTWPLIIIDAIRGKDRA
jgi:hypothetical protein